MLVTVLCFFHSCGCDLVGKFSRFLLEHRMEVCCGSLCCSSNTNTAEVQRLKWEVFSPAVTRGAFLRWPSDPGNELKPFYLWRGLFCSQQQGNRLLLCVKTSLGGGKQLTWCALVGTGNWGQQGLVFQPLTHYIT